jgi:glycosyltransferase involved in cell wall biosynthesis
MGCGVPLCSPFLGGRVDNLKVAVFVDKPVPRERPTGIGVAAFNMSLALSRRGLTVHYVCRGDTDKTVWVNDHLAVHTARNYSRDNIRVALDVMRRERPEVVHVHSTAALPSLLLGRALGRAVVVHSHGDEPLHPLRLGLMRKIEMDFSDRVVAVSEDTRTELITHQHLSPNKVVVAYNGVNIDDFKPSSDRFSEVLAKYGLENFDRIVLSIGAVQARKGQWRIIRCLPTILKEWPNLAYVNVGRPYDEAYQVRLREDAERLGISDNVRFLSGVPHEDLVALINSAWLCVHPSTQEAFGLAVVEEMACGKPVIAFKVAALPEIIEDGVDGILLAPGDSLGLMTWILNLLDDASLAKRMGEAARQKVATKFTWDLAAAQLERIYEGLVSNR